MKYTKKQFLADVAKEAKALKRNATKEEIEKLNIQSLDPESKYDCVYGLMTGRCDKPRAVELIESCCKRFIDLTEINPIQNTGFRAISKNINGAKAPSERLEYTLGYLSSIEAYIILPKAKNKNLIDYLKGERKDLVL